MSPAIQEKFNFRSRTREPASARAEGLDLFFLQSVTQLVFCNSNRFATPGGHSGLEASRASNFQNEGFEACKEQKTTTSTQAKTKDNC